MLGTRHPTFHNINWAHFGLFPWSCCAKSVFNLYHFGTTNLQTLLLLAVKPGCIAMVTRRVVEAIAVQYILTAGGHTGNEKVLNENG
jgi:hypothetical protein